ncbi:MAG: MFS transporter, partial [Lachnospiraceae bacterium]|nr:MFS transporter [Lachnospiraceae bacterium]
IGNPALLGVVSMASLVIIVGLIFNPALVKRFGIYKVNLYSYVITSVIAAVVMIFTYTESLGGLVAASFVRAITMAPLMGSLNAIVAEVARNSYLKSGKHTEGMMFSCSSIGIKVGGGIGAGLAGWLLAAAGYVGTAEVQAPAVLSMIKFIYGGIPLILTILITVCLAFMKVEEDNRKLEKTA